MRDEQGDAATHKLLSSWFIYVFFYVCVLGCVFKNSCNEMLIACLILEICEQECTVYTLTFIKNTSIIFIVWKRWKTRATMTDFVAVEIVSSLFARLIDAHSEFVFFISFTRNSHLTREKKHIGNEWLNGWIKKSQNNKKAILNFRVWISSQDRRGYEDAEEKLREWERRREEMRWKNICSILPMNWFIAFMCSARICSVLLYRVFNAHIES